MTTAKRYLFWLTYLPVGVFCVLLSLLAMPVVWIAGECSPVSRFLHNCIWYPAEYWADYCLGTDARWWWVGDD